MLLTLTTTHQPATDLGFLLHKNPSRVQSFSLSFGMAHVFYPEARPEVCTVALLVEVDPIGLTRGRGPAGEGGVLEHYVNDRPYAASSSFLSVAIAEVFGTALAGRCKERPELAGTPLPLCAEISSLPCRGGVDLLKRLFEPLGYRISAEGLPLDETVPEWGDSRYFRLRLETTATLQSLLSHIYVLVPVLDNNKHYWVGDYEVEKLLRHGEGWLASHPEKETIASRYLKYQRVLVDDALARLVDGTAVDSTEALLHESPAEEQIERGMNLNEQRLGAVFSALKSSGAARVLDLGCGEGKLLRMLVADVQFKEIVGMDVSYRALEIARDRLRPERLPPARREAIRILHGSLAYRDTRLSGFDAAAVVEVIEHLDPVRLAAFERVVFGEARPAHVIVTTPNKEYNVKWETLPAGDFRHRDHRFEWTRAEFQSWAEGICLRFGYSVRFVSVGAEDVALGAPTQMGVFSR